MKLQIQQLNKNFPGKKVLNNINLDIKKGRIYGLLGPNDSGKTTLLRIISGLIKPSQGLLTIDSFEPSKVTKEFVSYMPTENFFPSWMKVKDSINFYEDFYPDFDLEKCSYLLKEESINSDEKINILSTGMKEKLKVILTLSREASLFLLDEPFNGIDTMSKDSIKKIIKRISNKENTIIITSHLIDELETLLDDVIILNHGKIVLDSSVESLKKEGNISIKEIYQEVLNV